MLWPAAAQAAVIFDNYRGQAAVPAGVTAPSYLNYSGGNSAVQLQNLVNFASATTNIASSGSDANIDWSTASGMLCNSAAGANWQTSNACKQWLQGRVVYALVVFPAAGTYAFSAAHDDEVKVEFSTNFAKSNAAHYRNFDYNVPVGQLSAYTANDIVYESIPGNFVVSRSNTCYAMRVHWNNQGGINHLRLRWTPPGQAAQIIPAANLRDPSDPASYDGCANFNTDIGIEKTGPVDFVASTPFAYSIKVWNYGPNPVSGVTVADLLPANVSYNAGSFSCTPSGAATCGTDSRGQAMAMTTGSLPVNASAGAADVAPAAGDYLVYRFMVTPSAAATSITNTAAITINDTNPVNNSSTFITQLRGKVVVEKTGPGSVLVGQGFDYVLKVTNNRIAAVTNPVVQDQLPPGVAATGPAICAPLNVPGALLTCTLAGTLAGGGASQSFTMQVSAPSVAAIVNYAATHPDPSGANENPPSPPGATCNALSTSCASAKTTVLGQPRLKVGKTASMDSFIVGLPATYAIKVENTGTGATSSDMTVSDQIAATLTIGALPQGCAATGQLVTCTIGAGLAPNSQVSFGIGVTPTAAAANTTLANTAQVTGGGDPACAGGCSSNQVLVPVKAPRLSIGKTASMESFVVGLSASYVITVRNTGTAATTASATVTDTIDSSLNIDSVPAGCAVVGQLVSCSVPAGLATSSQVSFVIAVTPLPVASNTAIANVAYVSGGGDPTCAVNCASNEVLVPVNASRLRIGKMASDNAFVVGQPAHYVLTVTNMGTGPTISDTLVSDVIATTLTIGTLPAPCTASGQLVTCTIGAGLATGSRVSFTIPVTPMTAAANTTIANSARVEGGGDPSCAAGCGSNEVVEPVNAPKLEIAKQASADVFVVGQAASYTITVKNTGTAATTAPALVRDVIASTLSIGALPAGCSVLEQVLSCTVAAGLGTGGQASFVIAVTPQAAAANTTLANTASVTGGGDPSCVANCNSPTVTTPVEAPKLVIDKTASTGAFAVGQTTSYVLTVRNTGTTATTEPATVRDVIASTLQLGALPPGCSAMGQVVSCVVPAGLAVNAQAGFEIVVTVLPGAVNTTILNTASVTGGGDPSCAVNCNSPTVVIPVNAPKLSLGKTFSSGLFAAGQSANYVFTVKNTGTVATSEQATVRDMLSTSLILGAMPAGCTASGQHVACVVAVGLGVGSTQSFVIPVTARASADRAVIVNKASVTGGGDPSCDTGCDSSVTTPVGPSLAPQSIPVDSPWMLALLSLLLAAAALSMRAGRPRP